MTIDDLLDLAALHGTTVLRQHLWQLSPRQQAELRDLLTLQRHKRSRYDVVLESLPSARVRYREHYELAEGWTTFGTAYSDRPGAITAARKLQQKYMAIEIVAVSSKRFEIRYDEPVPTKPPFKDTMRFSTKDPAIARARALRAYGYDVVVRTDGSKRYCDVTGLTGTLGVPTALGIDSTHTTSDEADTRANALKEVGFEASFKRAGSAWDVEITKLPRFDVPTGRNWMTTGGTTTTSTTTSPSTTTTVTKPTVVNPPAPSTITPIYTTTTTGHDPTKDWSGGTLREDSFLRASDLKTTQMGSGTAPGKLVFLSGATVTLKSKSGRWVEVQGTAHEKKGSATPVSVGTKTGWIQRAWTTMSRGVFKDLNVNDRSDDFPTLLHGDLTKADVKSIVLHQTGSAKGATTLSGYTSASLGAHYLVTETGEIILTVPLDAKCYHVKGDKTGFTGVSNSFAVGIEHSGTPLKLTVPDTATLAADCTSLRTKFKATPLSPKLQLRILNLSDAKLRQLAKDNRDDPTAKPTEWQLYQDITGPQKRATYLLVGKLMLEFGVGDASVYAHETVQYKTIGEGENIREFLTARTKYPTLVASLSTLSKSDAILAGTAALTTIVTTETDLVDALKRDATATENTAVSSGNSDATAREKLRSHFYDDFWFHYTQLEELVDFLAKNGSNNGASLATMLAAYKK